MRALTDLTTAILWNRAPINPDPPEVLDYLEVRNNELYEEWRIKYQRNLKMADLRGDLTGPLMDQDYANKVRCAKALLQDIKFQRALKSFPNKVAKRRLGA